ncbi:MAG: response regulator transcription factor [Actinomycetaceae bacterium]|nr:response regulator transcription factor [Actinomycetaceae bacterium]
MKVIVVEDQKLLLDSLVDTLEQEDDMEVVARLYDAAKVDDACATYQPDLVLMDVCTENGSSGIRATERLQKSFPHIKVVLMTGMADISFVQQAKEAGASSFIYKNISTKELLYVLRSTASDYSTFPQEQTMPVLGYNKLTEREIDVLRSVCSGLTRKEIAEELQVSENTIKASISSILTKTGFPSISRLAIYALSSGFIVTEDS